MTEMTDTQREMLTEYTRMLTVMCEGFDYVQANLVEETPQVDQVFQDLLTAFEQLNECHKQMLSIFSESQTINERIQGCVPILEELSTWFSLPSNTDKRNLLVNQVIPAFKQWKSEMNEFVQPHTLN